MAEGITACDMNCHNGNYNVIMYVFLTRQDPEEHINRWYSVRVQPTLLDPLAVITAWGSRENEFQQMHICPVATPEEAAQMAEKIVATKVKRGYHPHH